MPRLNQLFTCWGVTFRLAAKSVAERWHSRKRPRSRSPDVFMGRSLRRVEARLNERSVQMSTPSCLGVNVRITTFGCFCRPIHSLFSFASTMAEADVIIGLRPLANAKACLKRSPGKFESSGVAQIRNSNGAIKHAVCGRRVLNIRVRAEGEKKRDVWGRGVQKAGGGDVQVKRGPVEAASASAGHNRISPCRPLPIW